MNAGLADEAERVQFMNTMVFTEIKPQIDRLSPRERLKVLAYLKHLRQAENPRYKKELARRNAEMDAGKKVRWEDLKRQLGL
jgi:hypothetical protein